MVRTIFEIEKEFGVRSTIVVSTIRENNPCQLLSEQRVFDGHYN